MKYTSTRPIVSGFRWFTPMYIKSYSFAKILPRCVSALRQKWGCVSALRQTFCILAQKTVIIAQHLGDNFIGVNREIYFEQTSCERILMVYTDVHQILQFANYPAWLCFCTKAKMRYFGSENRDFCTASEWQLHRCKPWNIFRTYQLWADFNGLHRCTSNPAVC